MTIDELWHSGDETAWTLALERYPLQMKSNPALLELVRELEPLDLDRIRALDPQAWYKFLHDKYFPWKYTAANRLATTRRQLSEYAKRGELGKLFRIKEQLLSFPAENIAEGLGIALEIRGLGTAGASGLLTLMYPKHFGTVDQFVVKALREVNGLPERRMLERMNPEKLTASDGMILIQVMRAKAAENNRAFDSNTWTPKKVDEILWTYGRPAEH
jgi:hypothetical protein